MPPSASQPPDRRLVLNQARRNALTILIRAILAEIRNKMDQPFQSAPASEPVPIFVDRPQPGPSNVWNPEEAERQRRLETRLESDFSTPALRELKRATLKREWQAARVPAPPPPYTPAAEALVNPHKAIVEAQYRDTEEAEDVSGLQAMYPPTDTRLVTLSKEDRVCVISCMILLLLGLGHYSAHSRILLCHLTSSFALPMSALINEETEIARTRLLASKELSADAETQKRQAANASARRWKVGLASVAGAAVIGITGGIAAPIVAGAIGGIIGNLAQHPAQPVLEQPPTYAQAHLGSTRRQQTTVGRQLATSEHAEIVDVTSTMSQVQVQDEHGESDDGGIQLVDNDEYLMEIPSEPMPDDENEVQSAQLGSSSRSGGN